MEALSRFYCILPGRWTTLRERRWFDIRVRSVIHHRMRMFCQAGPITWSRVLSCMELEEKFRRTSFEVCDVKIFLLWMLLLEDDCAVLLAAG